MSKGPYLSNEEKILLNLLSLQAYFEEFEVPFRMAQEGMANYIGAARPNVTRSLKNLKKKGLIDERLSHITGHRRRKKVYFLTPPGMVRAEKLDKGLRKNLGLKEGDGKNALEAAMGAKEETSVQIRTVPAPMTKSIKNFFGRDEELNRLRKWDGGTGHFFVIFGIAGIGKTTLTRRFLEQEERHHIWYQFHETNTLEGVLHQIAVKLGKLNNKGLSRMMSDPSISGMDHGEYASALLNGLVSTGSILVLDDLHLAFDRMLKFLNLLLRSADEKGMAGLKIIITSRKVPNFYNRRDVKVNGTVCELPLEGLDKESSLDLLQKRGVLLEDFDKYYSLTKGHPLALELTESGTAFEPHRDALEFVKEEIFQGLDEGERELTKRISVFRFPVPKEYIQQQENGPKLLESLLEKALVRYDLGGFTLHGLVREFTYDRLGGKQRRGLHIDAGEFYAKLQGDPLDTLEAVHHFVKAGELERGLVLLKDQGDEMVREGFFELSYLLDELDREKLEKRDLLWVDYFKANTLLALGAREDAKPLLLRTMKGIKILSGDELARLELRTLDKLGSISTEEGRRKEALDQFDKAGKAYNKIRSKRGEDHLVFASSLNGKGLLQKQMGSADKAEGAYREALRLVDPIDDPSLYCTLSYNLGRLYEDSGDPDSAEEQYLKGMEAASESSNEHMIASLCNSLGDLAFKNDDWEAALAYFEKGLEHAIISRDVLDTTRSYLEMSQKISAPKQKGFLARVKAYFSGDDVKAVEISSLYDRISRIYLERQDWLGAKEFHSQTAALFARQNNKRREAKARNNLGLILKNLNDLDGSIKEYKTALELLQDIGEEKGEAITCFNIGAVYDEKGDKRSRDQWFKKAQTLFKRLNMNRELKVLKDWD